MMHLHPREVKLGASTRYPTKSMSILILQMWISNLLSFPWDNLSLVSHFDVLPSRCFKMLVRTHTLRELSRYREGQHDN